MKIDVIGVGFDNITLEEAAECAMELANSRSSAYVVTPNPEIVMNANKNPELMVALNEADLVLPDGIGVVYSAKIIGTPINQRVPGIDFASLFMEKLSKKNGSVYLFGAKPGVAEVAAQKLQEKYPGLEIVGTHDGYFDDDSEIIEDIANSSPDFLVVCLGSPKQEIWMKANKDKLNCGVMAGLGGCLDVFAGNVDRAPEKWQNMGLEWLYRLVKEPSRIGRMIKLPGILFKAYGQKMRGN